MSPQWLRYAGLASWLSQTTCAGRPGLRAGEGPNMVRAVHAICHLHTAPTTSALGHVRRLAHLGTRTTERGSSVTTTNNFVALYCCLVILLPIENPTPCGSLQPSPTVQLSSSILILLAMC